MSCELCGEKSMNCNCTVREIDLSQTVACMEVDPAVLRNALEKSVKLQSHYAELLNMYDGGARMQFASADDWIKRLNENGESNG